MKKSLVLLIFVLIIPRIVEADLGAPTIQSICKITLIDGTKIEGIVSFGGGGYFYNYKPHGFCFLHGNGSYDLRLFKLDFRRFSPSGLSGYRKGTSKLYFVNNISKRPNPENKYSFNDTTNVLTKISTEIDQYKLDTIFKIYKELSINLYLNYGDIDNLETIEIRISELASFEFIKNPSEYWLKLIENSRTRLREKMVEDEKNGNRWIDYMEPAWYHEIIKDDKQLQYLKQYF